MSSVDRMTASLTLTDFLLARIEDDVRRAQQTSWARVRVLAECHAKRLIVEEFTRVDETGVDHELGYGLFFAVKHLAAVYSDHPSYRDEWRP